MNEPAGLELLWLWTYPAVQGMQACCLSWNKVLAALACKPIRCLLAHSSWPHLHMIQHRLSGFATACHMHATHAHAGHTCCMRLTRNW